MLVAKDVYVLAEDGKLFCRHHEYLSNINGGHEYDVRLGCHSEEYVRVRLIAAPFLFMAVFFKI